MVTQPGPVDDADSGDLVEPWLPGRSGPARWRRAALLTGLVLALSGLAVAAAGVVSQALPRQFNATQRRQIEAWEVARRWRTLPESVIFPASTHYLLPAAVLYGGQDLTLSAHRLGVSPPAGCASGADPRAARILGAYHCTALLRATYADATGSMVATVGVAVLPDDADAVAAGSKLGTAQPDSRLYGVRSAPVARTLAANFHDAQRQLFLNSRAGPYLILTAVGYTDGRPRTRLSPESYLYQEMNSLAEGLSDATSSVLGQPPPSPVCPGAPGC